MSFRKIDNIFLETVNSTNIWSKENLSSVDENIIYAVSAEEQTQGNGRLDRKWLSQKRISLQTTFVFKIKKN